MRVLIVGAGIGGLTAAVALRAAGIDAEVFERSPDVRATLVGGGFHLWPHALRALAEIGLDEPAHAIGAPLLRTEFCSARGRRLAEWPLERIAAEVGGSDLGVSRQDLIGMLHDALGGDGLHASAQLSELALSDDGVIARFTDGREEQGDVLIGADGLRSTVRAQLHREQQPRYAGYVQWQTLIDPPAGLFPNGLERITFGPGTRAVMHHIGAGRLFWAAVIYCAAEAGGRPEGRKAALLSRFAGWPEPLTAAIELSAEESINGIAIYDRNPVSGWGRGRVTLLGDAAHPMTTNTSQGGNLTIEDAVLLARLLAGGGDPVAALREYERRRQARTAPLVKASRFVSDMNAWGDPARVRAREMMMRWVLPRRGVEELRAAEAAML